MLLMIDNYDSFTYNLVQYFGELGAETKVYRNDQITIDEIKAMSPERIVLSPGPCTPDQAGICLDVVEHFSANIPLLGVCLGHQAIAQAFGGSIIRARHIMHGKTSLVYHNEQGVFAGLNDPFEATRYHSLIANSKDLPDCLTITAWTEFDDGSVDEIMGFRHKELPVEGVQFHPESILTEQGHDLLRNFLLMSAA